MSLCDYPNRQAVGLDPPWVEAKAGRLSPPGTRSGPPTLDDMTKDELLAYAKEREISPANAAMSKDEIRESIEENG